MGDAGSEQTQEQFLEILDQVQQHREFPDDDLVIRTQHFHCCGLGSIPGLGTEFLHQAIACCSQEKKKKARWDLN